MKETNDKKRLTKDQIKLGNNWERVVIGKKDIENKEIYPREISRYNFASKFIKKNMKVLELGCSSGYGTQLIEKDIKYTGVDYDEAIVKYATKNFGDANHDFVFVNIDKFLERMTKYDVIIAFEILEHLKNGKQLAQKLKKHCDTLLATIPHNEPIGFWGEHHVLHKLTEKDFPRFKIKYIHQDGKIDDNSDIEVAGLLMLVWQSEGGAK